MKKVMMSIVLLMVLSLGIKQEAKAQWYKSKTFLVYAQAALSPIPGTISIIGWFHVSSYIYGPKWNNVMVLVSPLPQTSTGKLPKGSVIRVVDEMTGMEIQGSQKLDIINLAEN